MRPSSYFRGTGLKRILILDHGEAFGGTVVVAAMLMHHLDPLKFEAVLATAANPSFAASRVGENGEVVCLRPAFSYVDASRLRRRILGVKPTFARRAINRIAFALCSPLNLGYTLRLFLLIRNRGISLVHCNNFDNFEGLVLAWMLGIPCVMHAHGMSGKLEWVSRYFGEQLRAPVVAISQAVANTLEVSGIARDRIHVLYNPVEPSDISASGSPSFRTHLGIPEHCVLVGIVGRVIAWKGQREFVLAGIRALATVPNLQIAIVGDGADFDDGYLESVKKLAKESPYASHFHFSGFVQDISSVYRGLDILVHASIEPEPFGLVITEAMVHGVPVIAATTGAPPELIDDGKTGFLRSPSDTKALADCLTQLAKDKDLRRRVGEAGRSYARKTFDGASYAKHFEQLYDDTIARQSS